MSPTIERRTLVEPVEFRAKGDKLQAAGYAAKFNTYSQNLGGFVEQIAPGAFTQTLADADIRALFNHDPNRLLGRNTAGTLRMAEDDTGLSYEIDLPDNTVGRDVAEYLERRDVTGSSFGFRTIDDEWGETEQEFPLRTLKAVALRDVGPVTFPAYTDTESSLRHLAEARSLDLNDLVKAAADGTLRTLISAPADERDDEPADDGRETPTVHRIGTASLS